MGRGQTPTPVDEGLTGKELPSRTPKRDTFITLANPGMGGPVHASRPVKGKGGKTNMDEWGENKSSNKGLLNTGKQNRSTGERDMSRPLPCHSDAPTREKPNKPTTRAKEDEVQKKGPVDAQQEVGTQPQVKRVTFSDLETEVGNPRTKDPEPNGMTGGPPPIATPISGKSTQRHETTNVDDKPTVCQLSSLSKFKVKVVIGGQQIDAVVDTAAEVSIISTEVYCSMRNPPERVKSVTLLTAGKEMSMKGFIVGPCHLKIGSTRYNEFVHVAPIAQDMLLGFDFLYSHGAVLDMGKAMLTIGGENIPLNVDATTGDPLVARVTVAKRQVVPPNSVMRLKCSLSKEIPEYLIEPVDNLKVLVPKSVYDGTKAPFVCVMNITDKYRLMKKGAHIAEAHAVDGPVDVIDELPEVSADSVCHTEPGQEDSNQPVEIPKHLEERHIPIIEGVFNGRGATQFCMFIA